MPDRSSAPLAPTATWRLTNTAVLASEAGVSLRQNLLVMNTAGFLIGYYAAYNQWIQLSWLAILSIGWMWAGGFQDFIQGLRQDGWLMSLFCLSLALLARSSMIESPGVTLTDLWFGWFSTGSLLLCLLMFWRVGQLPGVVRALGLPLVVAAAVTALGSILMFNVLDSRAVFGARLHNWFVYGGWNPVCTGMTFGFASLWAVHGWKSSPSSRHRAWWLLLVVLLILTTLMTMSRGALLAMVAGHLGLFAGGWRRARGPLLLLVGCVLLFQWSAPVIARLGAREVSVRTGLAPGSVTPEMLSDTLIAPNPAARVIERADNGRFEIYDAAWHSMTTWQDWLLGKGLWSANDFWSCSLDWYPAHLHSVFMDALVRGGVPTLLGLLGLIGWGGWRAWVLAREGEALWFMLACYGVAGLIFDGDSAFSLCSLPRFEALILWVPLVIASARYTLTRRML